MGRYMHKVLSMQGVREYQNKKKKFRFIFILYILFPPALFLGLVVTTSTLLRYVITFEYSLHVFYVIYLIMFVILFKVRPKISCYNCQEDLSGTYNQSSMEVVVCPYCSQKFK